MDKKLTTQEVMARIKQRRAIAESKKRLAERRATASQERPVRKSLINESQAQRPARKPLMETRRPSAARPVILENKPRVPKRTETLTENITKRNRDLKLNEAQSTMYNTLAENIIGATRKYESVMKGNLNEATQAHPIAGLNNQAGVGLVQTFLDIFYGYFPSLVAPLLASTQPLKTEQGFIFFMQYTAGSDKGMVAKGDVLIDPFQVNTPVEYTSNQATIATLDTGSTGAVALWAPYIARSVQIEGHDLTWSSDTAFAVDGTAVTGAVTVSGDTSITVELTGTLAAPAKISYKYNNAFVPTQVPELTANVQRLPIAAQYRTIKTNYAFTAAFGFEAEHGANLGDKLAEAAMFELKREIDLETVFAIMNSAPETVVWNKDAGFAVGGYNDHKLTFLDAVVAAANRIWKKSKRVRGNILMVSIEALNIVETLPFYDGVQTGDQLDGAGVVGHLKKMPVIAVPELPENEWAVIYKSKQNNLDAGIVFAPYIPVFATEPVTLDDLQIRRAFITAYALKVVNPNYFVRGRIIKDPVALPVYVVTKDGDMQGTAGELGLDATLEVFGE